MPTAYLDNLVPKSPRKRRVTIADVADALDLTKGTVSRALNNYPDISDRTRKRVAKQAERMGYRPLSHAQAIRTGRTKSLGLVLQTNAHDAQRPFLSDFLAGVTQEASAQGWSLTVATAHSQASMQATLERLINEHKADGFILPRTMVHDERIDLLRTAHVPFVLYGRTGDDTDCAWFDILGENAMRDAVLRLAGMGHRRIGFVNGGAGFNYAALRHAGYLAGLTQAGLGADPQLEAADAVTAEDGERATARLLELAAPPTALVFAVDMAALGAYGAAASRGLTIGRELSVIGYDGVPEGAYATPPLTTFNVDTRRAGERLAHLLIARIRGADPATLRECENARLLERASDGPPAVTSEELARLVRAAGNHDETNGRTR